MDKKIEELELKIKELEDKLNQSSNMFGRSYSLAGSSDSDFLIKTRGLVKIQWGSKFIDLLKDGKINAGAKFIYIEDNVGTKDGIYITDGGQNVTLVADGKPINLIGEIGTTYVSFLEGLEANSEQKRLALINIGFLYPRISDVGVSALKNGIIYVEEDHKLYTIIDGSLSEFRVNIPNPFTQLFIVAKTSDSNGAIVIEGTGIKNSLAFSKMYIYSEDNKNVIQSDVSLNISATQISLSASLVGVTGKLIADSIESTSNPREDGGYRIYREEGSSILEIDKVIERESNTSVAYPAEYYLDAKVIDSADISEEGSTIMVTFTLEHSYNAGDILLVYTIGVTGMVSSITPEDDSEEEFEPEEISVKIITPNILKVARIIDEVSIEVNPDTDDVESLVGDLIGLKVFLVKSMSEEKLLRISRNNLDVLDYDSEDLTSETINLRIGNLSPLNLKEKNGESEVDVEGYGIYVKKAIADEISYTSSYNLPDDDDSSKVASTEWVNKKLKDADTSNDIIVLFSGSILSYNSASSGYSVPFTVKEGSLFDKSVSGLNISYDMYGNALNITLEPSSGYTCTPTSISAHVTKTAKYDITVLGNAIEDYGCWTTGGVEGDTIFIAVLKIEGGNVHSIAIRETNIINLTIFGQGQKVEG